MKNVRITVKRIARYDDLIAEYENPIEHACGMTVGQVFLSRGGQRPDGFCDSAWETVSPFVLALSGRGGFLRRMDEEQKISDDLVQRRISPGQFPVGDGGR